MTTPHPQFSSGSLGFQNPLTSARKLYLIALCSGPDSPIQGLASTRGVARKEGCLLLGGLRWQRKAYVFGQCVLVSVQGAFTWMSVCACLSVFPCVCVHTCMCMSVHVLTHVIVSETMCMLICLYVHACPCLYLCLSVCLCVTYMCIFQMCGRMY